MKKENPEEALCLQGDASRSIEFLSVCIFNNQFTCISANYMKKTLIRTITRLLKLKKTFSLIGVPMFLYKQESNYYFLSEGLVTACHFL